MTDGPKVSVATVAYNHCQFIRQSVESSLGQDTDFPYEVVVGEDCSTDGTREILAEMEAVNPDKLRVLFREKNLGMQWNYARTVEACRGEYVAVLDSDDYWTSRDKLATQVQFMDEHPDYAISFHSTSVSFEDNPDKHSYLPPSLTKNVSNIADLLIGNYMPSCTIMYRRSCLPPFPDWYGEVYTYDWVLHALVLAQGGQAGFIRRNMAVYRVHKASLWSALEVRQKLRNDIGFYEKILKVIPAQWHAAANYGMALRLFDLAIDYRRAGEFKEARELFKRALSLESEGYELHKKKKMRMRLRLALRLKGNKRRRK